MTEPTVPRNMQPARRPPSTYSMLLDAFNEQAGELTNARRELEAAREAIRQQGTMNEHGEWHLDHCPWEDGCSPDCEAARRALRGEP